MIQGLVQDEISQGVSLVEAKGGYMAREGSLVAQSHLLICHRYGCPLTQGFDKSYETTAGPMAAG